MDHVWTVFCRRTLIDADTKQISIIDSIDDISVEITAGKTAVFIDCVVATLWARSNFSQPEKGKFRMSLQGPDGELVSGPQVYPIDLENSRWSRTRVALSGLPIGKPGRYVFIVELEEDGGWRTVSRTPYELEIEVKEETRSPQLRKRPRRK